MKAILEFNLPDDDIEYRNTIDARRAKRLISDIKGDIRYILKYWPETKTVEDYKVALEKIRSAIYEEFPDIDDN